MEHFLLRKSLRRCCGEIFWKFFGEEEVGKEGSVKSLGGGGGGRGGVRADQVLCQQESDLQVWSTYVTFYVLVLRTAQ